MRSAVPGALGPLLDGSRRRVEAARRARPPAVLWGLARARAAVDPPRALLPGRLDRAPAVIAEIKRRSPSGGILRADLDPEAVARAYADAGAAAVSVLTEPDAFGGRLEDLALARRAGLPCLRKDFVVDPYQVAEALVAGADAVLLIVAGLTAPVLHACQRAAQDLGMTALVEVHDEAELERALAAGTLYLGINNRDLDRLTTDLGVTERLRPRVPPEILVVAESGIHGPDDLGRMADAGVDAVLVGEQLMRSRDPGAACRELVAAAASSRPPAGAR
ncbi:MAG TPA: indole-3-glycerol phosphate synthase TrpC [Verrucomicrobiae bacterium]|nr:indole-3-glycerol phosphate synthase TrpC [Verrucomicrobiae bacterium]